MQEGEETFVQAYKCTYRHSDLKVKPYKHAQPLNQDASKITTVQLTQHLSQHQSSECFTILAV